MRNTFALGLLLITLPASAQLEGAAVSRFSIGITGSMDHCFRILANNRGDENTDRVIDLRNRSEIPKLSYSINADLLFHLDERWALISGLRYSDQGYRTEEFNEFASVDAPEGDPAIPIGGIQYVYHFHYLSVPLLVQFRMGKGRLRFTPAIGLAGDILLEPTETTHSKWKDGRETSETRSAAQVGYNPISLSVRTELGGAYRIAERFELNAGLAGLYQITELIDAPITGHQWTVGFQCGTRYRL
ncbi:MAG: PorT family protein [Flavobacteriales bacterium]|nr:PorT family protein [Flavobacteriales bacterium]